MNLLVTSLETAVQRALPDSREQAAQQNAKVQVRETQEHFALFMRHFPGPAYIKDAEGRFQFANHSLLQLTGKSCGPLIGRTVRDLWPELAAEHESNDRRVFADGEAIQAIERIPQDDGVHSFLVHKFPIPDAEGRPLMLGGVAIDFTERLRIEAEKKAQLDYLAYYDALTGLPNRALFSDRVNQAVQWRDRRETRMAVLAIDIDRFAYINDSLGRQTGDSLLKLIALRLQDILAQSGSVTRIGSDAFAISLTNIRRDAEVARILEEKIFDALSLPYTIEARELRLSFKCGAAVCPEDGDDADVLLAKAEAALKKAKGSGDHYLFYTPAMNARIAEVLNLENKLRVAVAEEQFVLHYQPKVAIHDNSIVSLEALIRWNSPELGLVPPNDFIPILEDTGMILDVGMWVLKQAAADHRRWKGYGLQPPRIAVNVSSIQLRQKQFVENALATIRTGGADPAEFDIELTESVIMENIAEHIPKLEALRAAGMGIEIDDFGTGYSSLNYIRRLPVTALKIDRSFIIEMLDESENGTIVSAIISLAHLLKLAVVAEGVETDEQLAMLRSLDCDTMQGYLFSPPLTGGEIEVLLGS